MPPKVGLLMWGDVIEDFLNQLNLDLEFFRYASGGWLWNYLEALREAGVPSVLFAVSARVRAPLHLTNEPTGTPVCLLPSPAVYRALRHVDQRYGIPAGRWRVPGLAIRRYLSTPLLGLARELRRHGCDRLVCQEYENPRFEACVALGKVLRIPIFATFQGGRRQRSRLEAPFRQRAINACAGLIIGSSVEAQRVRTRYGVPSARIAQIFNPVPVAARMDRSAARAALNIPETAWVAVSHGRVEFVKGQDVLVEAWRDLRARWPEQDLRLLLVGSGRYAAKLHEQLERDPLEGVCWIDRYVTDRQELARYLSAADAYVLSSRGHEGFPVAPLEAMAFGLPIVATDVEGVGDILPNGAASGGLVVAPGDATALARGLGELVGDPDRTRAMGIRARRRVETAFSFAVVGSQLREFVAG